YQLGKVKSESVRQQNVDLLVNVDKELATIVAENIGVNPPSGTNVPVETRYPSLSQANTPKYAATQRVGVLIGDGFNSQEVSGVLNQLKQNGVFIRIISNKLGMVTGSDGSQLKVDQTFITSSPYLVDAIYVVGGTARNQAMFNKDVTRFLHKAYEQYKPIGIASTGQSYLQPAEQNNLSGVIF